MGKVIPLHRVARATKDFRAIGNPPPEVLAEVERVDAELNREPVRGEAWWLLGGAVAALAFIGGLIWLGSATL